MTKARDNATQGGLTLISSTTFTTASSLSLNNVFTSAYKDYKVIVNVDTSSVLNANLQMRLRANGTDDTSTNYYQASYQVADTGSSSYWDIGGKGYWGLFKMDNPANSYSSITFDLLNPQATKFTMLSGLSNFGESGQVNLRFAMNGGKYIGTTQFDGLTLYPASGTASGLIKIYGYRN